MLCVCSRALPRYAPGGAAVIHEACVNPGQRRGRQKASNNSTAILDFLHAYRRWPAPTPELKAARAGLMKSVGLALPGEWY